MEWFWEWFESNPSYFAFWGAVVLFAGLVWWDLRTILKSLTRK